MISVFFKLAAYLKQITLLSFKRLIFAPVNQSCQSRLLKPQDDDSEDNTG